jgi:hypothetical protein
VRKLQRVWALRISDVDLRTQIFLQEDQKGRSESWGRRGDRELALQWTKTSRPTKDLKRDASSNRRSAKILSFARTSDLPIFL